MKFKILAGILLLSGVPALADDGDVSLLITAHWLQKTGEDPFEDGVTGQHLDIDFDPGAGLGFGINWFVTDTVSLEARSAGIWTEAEVRTVRTDAVSTLMLGSVRMYPTTAVLQYHFSRRGDFKWYVGAGVAYVIFDEFEHEDLLGGAKLENDTGFTTNIGVDYSFSSQWDLNVDVKYVPFATSPGLTMDGQTTDEFELEPFLVSAGVRYRF